MAVELMEVTDDVVRSMSRGRVFKDHDARINSIDFHRTEDLLVSAGDDHLIQVYNTASGESVATVNSKKYGAANVCFTHHTNAVLHSTNKQTDKKDHALRYLSMFDSRYIRYFVGHTDRVNTLRMSPRSDLFMSAAQDKTMRLWDLRTAVCQGVLVAPGPVAATFDHQGLVFAAASHCGLVKMYDVRAYDKGPFQTVVVVDESNSPLAFSDIKFSPDGKMLLAGLEGRTYVLDSFSGSQLARLATPFSPGSLAMEASFSADSKYVLQGCASDNSVRVWAVPSGTEVASLTGHAAAPTCVKWAPRRALVASACHALVLWIPNLAALQQQAAGAAMQIDGHSR